MHHVKLLRSKSLRSAIIPAGLLCVIASGCAEQEPAGPVLPRVVARSSDVSLNRFFIAWSHSYVAGPIQPQVFALDPRQDRQYSDLYPSENLLAFARANPGRLYIDSDEPDQWCIAPSDYANIYHDWAAALRSADPTARVSPAGVAEPNWHCCPLPDDVPAPCWSASHSIGYMQQFYDAYTQRYGAPPPVNEWRFHDFALKFAAGDIAGWWARVDQEASWSVAHGANMFLGAWGFLGWRESDADYSEHIKRGMNLILNDKRITGAAYWAYQSWAGEHHFLTNDDGSLTPEGQTYADPLADIPTGLEIVGSPARVAALRWNNTTSAWPVEAEFWVQAPASNSFVYRTTELLSPGGNETAQVAFNPGDIVKGRVRYYNALGQAAWSSFSNTVSMRNAVVRKTPAKGPVFCLLQGC
ncbi:MAG: hypothetical protein ABR582_13235 [Gemmatimonadaceae bacterium]